MPKSVFTDAYRELLALLIETRVAAGVTQVELAKRLGRPQPFVSYIERGERRLDIVEFVALARALNADPKQLFEKLLQRIPNSITI